MSYRDHDDTPWIMIGFKLGIGFCLASSIFAAVGGLAAYAIAHYQITVANNELTRALGAYRTQPFVPPPINTQLQNLQDTAQDAMRNLDIHRAPPGPPPTTLAPEDNKACLAQSHGVFNEAYTACMRANHPLH